MEHKIAYLNMIQAIISRMSNYGFMLKGWGMTILAALLALAFQKEEPQMNMLLVGLLPTIAFWWLDAFFLNAEHKFRALYEHARLMPESDIDFDLTPKKEYPIKPPATEADAVKAIVCLAFSKTLLVFWGVLVVLQLGGYAVLRCG